MVEEEVEVRVGEEGEEHPEAEAGVLVVAVVEADVGPDLHLTPELVYSFRFYQIAFRVLDLVASLFSYIAT